MKVYRGQLVATSNGEEENLLGLVSEEGSCTLLADELSSLDNKIWTVRYFISDKPMSKDELDYNLAKLASGISDVEYEMRYSEYTGYLWTDEKLKVGGHDLLDELKSNKGKYLHLEIELS